jgi:hypothetical protein
VCHTDLELLGKLCAVLSGLQRLNGGWGCPGMPNGPPRAGAARQVAMATVRSSKSNLQHHLASLGAA